MDPSSLWRACNLHVRELVSLLKVSDLKVPENEVCC